VVGARLRRQVSILLILPLISFSNPESASASYSGSGFQTTIGGRVVDFASGTLADFYIIDSSMIGTSGQNHGDPFDGGLFADICSDDACTGTSFVSSGSATYTQYFGVGTANTTARTYVGAAQTISGLSVTASYKFSATHAATRMLINVTNSSPSSISRKIRFRSNLGSDGGSRLVYDSNRQTIGSYWTATSNTSFGNGVLWTITTDATANASSVGSDPVMSFVYGESGASLSPFYVGSDSGIDNVVGAYSVVVPANSTRSVMLVWGMGGISTTSNVLSDAYNGVIANLVTWNKLPADLKSDLTSTQTGQILNWNIGPALTNSAGPSYSVTAGVPFTDTVTATGGTGPYTILFNPTTTGISFNNTDKVITVNVNTPATVQETLTVTDSQSKTSTLILTIRINSPPSASISNSTISTTLGRAAAETLTVTGGTTSATGGTGNLVFTRQSSNSQAGITLDTSTASSGRAVVRVAATGVSAGTYYETITARDNVGATTTSVFTVIVSPAPTLSGSRTVANETLTTTVGVVTSETVTVTGGTGNKTFTLTQGAVSSAGITLDTTTANSGFVVLRVANNVTANTYLETITATDTRGSVVTYFFRVTVNPIITIGSATSSSFATPSGTAATNTLTVAGGTTPRTMTLTSSPPNAGITLTTGGSGQAVLNIASTVAAATYIETITVTDAVGAVATHVVTLTVSGPIRFDSSNVTTINTSFGRAASTVLATQSGNTGKTFTKVSVSSPTSAGITLDTSTAGSGFATLNVSASTAIGTYLESITVVDSSNSRATTVVTINVNPSPVITFESSTAGSNFSSLTMSTGNYVTLPASTEWQLGSTYTIEWWQYQTDSQQYPRVFKVGGLEVSLEGNTFYYWVNGARVMNAIGTLNVKNKWVHFAIVSRNNSVTVYQDGIALKAAQTLPTVNSSIVSASSQFCLATQCNSTGFSTFGGQLTNFQISTIDRYSGISLSAANFTPSKFVTIDNNTILALTSVNAEAKMSDASSASRIASNVGSPTGSSRHPAASSSSVTVVTTQGLATRSSPFTASSGTGNKTFTLTPTISGITLDTSTLNTAVIVLDPSLAATNSTTAATYNESVTATDSLNTSTSFNVAITVNPRIALTAVTQTLTTSSGVAAFDTITATTGTGTGAITFSLVSNPFSSGITLVSGGARSTVLTVARTVPQGTYYETITATDSLGATTSIPVTVVVNPGISLVGEGNVSTITTSVGRTASLQVNALDGASGRTFTMSPVISGITLDTTNAASGYAVVRVANTVLANTYYETVTVTDSAGGTASLMVTIVVNAAPTLTGPTTVAMTSGRAASTTIYTTASGSGTKTFSLSGVNAGVTIETSTPTTAFVRLASTLTSTSTTQPRTITETVTATDAAGATARVTLTITVNPAVIETATVLSLTTTSGVAASTTVFATQGTGNKTFTRTSATASAGITMTTLVTNQALISVASSVSSGTYFETITATDSLGAETSTVITITVNGAPTVSGATNLVTTFGVGFTSPIYTAASGNGIYTFSLVSNPSNVGITVSSSVNGQARVSITSGVAAGTYNETLTVTDGLGATGRMNFTIRVNAPVALTGTQTVNATYGEAFTTGFNSSGGTGPFVFSASNLCAVSRSTYIGDGNNGTVNGISYTVDQIRGDGTCNWVAPLGVETASVLVVGGGGAGGTRAGGGGGAGGYQYVASQPVVPNTAYSVIVGAGGTGVLLTSALNGGDSRFGSLTLVKGGGGGGGAITTGKEARRGKDGGSGGGAAGFNESDFPTAGLGTTNQGNSGGIAAVLNAWPGGGGGGASSAGATPVNNTSSAGKGGSGTSNSITGMPVCYATGGGGGTNVYWAPGTSGGAGGDCGAAAAPNGGSGTSTSLTPANPTPNTGAGGGGSGWSASGDLVGGNGASGIVVLRYVTPNVDADNSRISYLVSSPGTSSSAGLLTLSIPESVTAGSYSHTVKVTDSNGAASTPVTINITVAKANPVLTLSLPGGVTSTPYGFGVTLSAQASTGGVVNFRDNGTTITGCGTKSTTAFVATCRWVPNTVATRTISAVFTPTDTANYNSGITTTMSVVVTQADTLTVTARSESFVFTDTTTAVTRGFTITGLAEIDSATAVTMTYIGSPNDTTAPSWSSATAPRLAGDTYEIRPSALVFTSGASSNYRAITYVSGNLAVTRAPQVANFNYRNSNQLTYSLGGTETTTVTKLGEATPLFSQTTPDKCSINSSTGTLSILEAGTCSVTMDVPEGFNYLTTTVSKNVTIAKAARTITLTASALTIKYGDTATVTTTITAGALDGLITYTASSPTSCSFDQPSGVMTAIAGSGTCGLTARIAEGINFLGETSTALSITTAKADGPEVRVGQTIPVAYTGSTAVITPTFTVSGLKLTDVASTSLTFTYTNFGNTAYSSTTAPTLGGTYRINPSALSLTSGSLTNYNSPIYVFAEFVIESIDQPELVFTNLTGDLAFPVTLRTTGGHPSTPAVTYQAINGTATNCRVSYGALSNSGGQSVWYLQADSAGSCSVIATKPADRNYRVAISDTSTVTVLEFKVYVVPVVANSATGITVTPTVPLTKGPDVCTSGCVPQILTLDFYTRYPGDMLVITGKNLTGTTKVIFNVFTQATNFSVDSDTQITVQVPVGLPAGETGIEVVAPGGTSARNFALEIL
jgi:hypothetical protein